MAREAERKVPQFSCRKPLIKPCPTSPRGMKKKILILRDALFNLTKTFDQISRSQSKWNRTIDRLWPFVRRKGRQVAGPITTPRGIVAAHFYAQGNDCSINHTVESSWNNPRRRKFISFQRRRSVLSWATFQLLWILQGKVLLLSTTAFNLSHKSTALRNQHKRIHWADSRSNWNIPRAQTFTENTK